MPAGFRAMGAPIGIKPSGRPDFAVIATTGGPAAAAGVFTRNAFAAAPVRLTRAHLAETGGDGPAGSGWADAILSTSGSANAATGALGDADQDVPRRQAWPRRSARAPTGRSPSRPA